MKQIIRLMIKNDDSGRKTKYKSFNMDQNDFNAYGYMLNEDVAEMLFYDTVLLVEGSSEKYFYNSLYNNDDNFRNFVQKNNFGIFNVMGVDFQPIKNLLNQLGIKVLIKTDNDISKVPKMKLNTYAGIVRAIKCLNENAKEELCAILEIDELDQKNFRFPLDNEYDPDIENKMSEIQNFFAKNGIYLSLSHDGFENDFLEFIDKNKIDPDDMKYLQKKKMKNLHKYVIENDIKFKINEDNKNSILLRFMDNE